MNKRWISVIGLFLVLSTTIATVGCGKEPIATPYVAEEFVVCNTSGNHMLPRISGDIVVWVDDRNTTPEAAKFNKNTDIYAYNLNDGLEFPICTQGSYQGDPDIDGNIIVWTDGRNDDEDNTNADIYGYDLSSHTEFIICNETHNQWAPAISGNILVWRDTRTENTSIYGYNISSGGEFSISTYPSIKMSPSIYGDIATWLDFREAEMISGENIIIDTEIYARNISSGPEFAVTDDELMQDPPGADIYGDVIVWSEGHRNESATFICRYNLKTHDKSMLTTSPDAMMRDPVIYGDIIVWNDYRNGNGDIYGYNLETGEEFAICTDPGQQQNPAIYGNIVIWEDNREEVADSFDIYGARLTFDNP